MKTKLLFDNTKEVREEKKMVRFWTEEQKNRTALLLLVSKTACFKNSKKINGAVRCLFQEPLKEKKWCCSSSACFKNRSKKRSALFWSKKPSLWVEKNTKRKEIIVSRKEGFLLLKNSDKRCSSVLLFREEKRRQEKRRQEKRRKDKRRQEKRREDKRREEKTRDDFFSWAKQETSKNSQLITFCFRN